MKLLRVVHMGIPELAWRGRQEASKWLERIGVAGRAASPPGEAATLLEQGGRFTGRARSSSGHTDSLEPLRGFLPAAPGQFGDSHVHHAQELHATRPA